MNKPIYLLDTNVISELSKPFPNQNVVSKINELKHLCAISCTTWSELLYGVEIMSPGKNRDYRFSFLIDEIQTLFPVIHYDNHSAWIQADIRSKLKEAGKVKSFQDTQIAAIAISNQMTLITRNIDDFEPMQEVSSVFYLENWFE